jgi:hypothetical protein
MAKEFSERVSKGKVQTRDTSDSEKSEPIPF